MRRAARKPRDLPRVLFAIGSLDPVGGSETQIVETMTRLHRVSIEAVLVTVGAPGVGRLGRQVADAGIEHLSIGWADTPRPVRAALAAERYARLMRRVDPDVVYAWLELSSLFLVPLARATARPVVVARRNLRGAQVERQWLMRHAIRRAERMANIVTGNSQAVIDAAVGRGIDPARLRLVRNGHPDVEPLPFPAGPPVIGYLANFRTMKGHTRALEAAANLPRDLRWRLAFAGQGPLLEPTRARAADLGLADRVSFEGRVDDVRVFWSHCHVAALLSDHEGSPNALIEAAFAGRPIVATPVGGIPEIVAADGGRLVDLDDPKGTAEALTELLAAPAETRAAIGLAAHDHACKRFNAAASAAAHLAAIREAIGPQR